MKRGLLTITCGLIAGLISYMGYLKAFSPCEDNTLECRLSWIQDYLSLSPEQYKMVVEIHRERQPEIGQLERKIKLLETRLADLEVERIQNDRIDFIAFYNYLQEKVDLDNTRNSETESLFTQMNSIMSREQQERFHDLIQDFKSTSLQGS